MGPAAGWDARIDLVKSKGMAAVVDAVLTRWFTCEFLRSENPAISKAREMLVKTDVQGYAGCCAAIRDMDMRPSVHLIKRSTLVLAGSQDTATPLEQSEELADTIPNARLTVFQTAHLSNMEKPDLFTQSVLEFLGSPH
jgi:3-oxoadipate enol-lactonase